MWSALFIHIIYLSTTIANLNKLQINILHNVKLFFFYYNTLSVHRQEDDVQPLAFHLSRPVHLQLEPTQQLSSLRDDHKGPLAQGSKMVAVVYRNKWSTDRKINSTLNYNCCSNNNTERVLNKVIIKFKFLFQMRLAALSILTTLLDGSKQFLMAAEDG